MLIYIKIHYPAD